MAKPNSTLNMYPSKNRRNILFLFGIILTIYGILQGVFAEHIFNYFLEKTMVLRPNSTILEMWRKPPMRLTLDFYLFNWTNSQDFYNTSVKPAFQELGPYRFVEKTEKVNIKWHAENDSISYNKLLKYEFDAEFSKGSLDDEITTINTLAISFATKTLHWAPIRRSFVSYTLKMYNHDITIKSSAGKLLFEGLEDSLLHSGYLLPRSIIDLIVPYDKFGYSYPRNNSADFSGVFNIHTGAKDIQKIGQIHSWNSMTNSRFYPKECSKIYGSPGEFQPPYLKSGQPINYFISDFCRSLPLDHDGVTEVDGVQGYKYIGSRRAVDNGTIYPENKCFCNGECAPIGVMNISSCWYDVKIFMSYPHFYLADPILLNAVEGLSPRKDEHELYVIIEPRTGYLLEASAKMQSNLLVEPLEHVSMLNKAPRIYFPLFWFEQKTRLSPELLANFSNITLTILCGRIFGICSLIGGLLLIFWYPLKQRFNRRLIQQIDINNEIREEQLQRTLDKAHSGLRTTLESTSLMDGNEFVAR